MGLISEVGRRSFSIRLLVLGMYALLTVGAVTMIYPFALMFSTATTSKADAEQFRLVPRFWHDDQELFKKYVVDAVQMRQLAVWFGRDGWFGVRDIKPEHFQALTQTPQETRQNIARRWRRFVTEVCPGEFKLPMFIAGGRDSPLALRPEYLAWLETRYGQINAVNAAYSDNATTWEELNLPTEIMSRQPDRSRRSQDWRTFVESRPPHRTGLLDVDVTVLEFLTARYGNAKRLHQQTAFTTDALTAVTFDHLQKGALGLDAKRTYYQQYAPARFVEVDIVAAESAWQDFLHENDKEPTNLPLTARMPVEPGSAALWSQFIQKTCPLAAMDMARPQEYWRTFLSELDDVNQTASEIRLSHATAIACYEAFLNRRTALRRQYLSHNFITVFRFVAVHGDALWVTIIYIVLLVGTTLTINPLAAYALSRFRLSEGHHVMVFLLATMAFPGEVLMIPTFLMIKSFPLLQLGVVAVSALGFLLVSRRLTRWLPLIPSAVGALIITALLAGWVIPTLASRYDVPISVSLLNTFWALVLPGLANGFWIFLLKGFFDSLPPELYEAGLIDGASELRMFWQITLPLCMPIMAVMALGAFTTAYSAFMHAFLVCQDPKMWTLMVFLYEFQQNHTIPMVMASLVIAAIPTLIVFILCQRVILRGIVIPTFK